MHLKYKDRKKSLQLTANSKQFTILLTCKLIKQTIQKNKKAKTQKSKKATNKEQPTTNQKAKIQTCFTQKQSFSLKNIIKNRMI